VTKPTIIELVEKAGSEKEPLGLPIPETPEARTALEILNAVTAEQCREILRTKVPAALRRWAMEKMGEDLGKFIDEGLRFYFFAVLLYSVITNKHNNAQEVLGKLPFVIPLRLRRSRLFPVDPSNALEEYLKILPHVQRIVSETRSEPLKRKMRLARKLGIRKKDADKFVEDNTKPSLIAYLPMGAEAVKKYIRYARDPELLINRIKEDYEERTGYKLERRQLA